MSYRRALALVSLAVLTACGVAGPASTTTSMQAVQSTAAPTTTTEALPVYPGFDEAGEVRGTLVALASEGVAVYQQPTDPEPWMVMPSTTILGTTTVLALVEEPVDDWAEVMLPVRPNGTTGWIPLDDVVLYVVDGKIEIDLSDRLLVYRVAGEERFRATVAIGTASNPTPTGLFYVTDRVSISESSGPWGPNAIGLSARSDTVTEFNGGDGIVGIHGTNRPRLIGESVSLGCVRLHNDEIALLHSMVPIGTMVEIRA
jgi:lipoprotein-anchoring transpeptidase ErfK/SrfK